MEVTTLSSTEQEIHATVKVRSSNFSWLLSAIYASPRHAKRQVLWNNLIKVAKLHNMPWVLAGDFNEPIIGKDKYGGRPVSVNRSLMLKECLDLCNMIDLGFTGPRFTWTKRRDIQGLIQERIDRFFVNPSWCLLYPEARVSHLTRCHSDHCPVLLELQPTVRNHRVRPFKFQRFWLSDVSFPKVVENVWGRIPGLTEAIDTFQHEATVWNKLHFGNIFAKKRKIMARLNGIQRAVAVRPLSSLLDLENKLLKELDVVLGQEQELWALKSRINWMVQGDRTTAFFHVSTLVRRKRNQILAIKNGVGEWLYAEAEVMDYIRKGFIDIYTSSSILSDRIQSGFSQWQARLSEEEKESLGSPVTEDEIKAGLWSLKAFKAPGPNGLHARFFQHFWPSVGLSVVEEVKKIFRERRMSDKLNQTHIVLIPKNQGRRLLGTIGQLVYVILPIR